jgi:hypothetical protein
MSCGAMLLVTSVFDGRDLAYQRTVRQCSSTCDLHTFDLSLILTAPSTISRQLIVTVSPSGTTVIDTKSEEYLKSHTSYKRASLTTILLDRCSILLKLSRPYRTYTQTKLVLLTNYYFPSRPQTTIRSTQAPCTVVLVLLVRLAWCVKSNLALSRLSVVSLPSFL